MEFIKEIEKNFPKIEKLFTKEMLLEFLQTPSDDLEKYNVGLGTMIRLKLLRPKSVLYKKFIESGFTNREKMAMAMIKEYHKYIQDKN